MTAVRALAILIVAAMAVSAIPMVMDEPPVENAAAADEGYVRVGWLSTIVNWNPLAIEMVEDYVACYLIHSALFTYDQDWNGPVNDLATGYSQEVHANGSMTTTISITHNAYYRNAANIDDTSHRLNSTDVVFALNLMKNNEGGAFDWYLLEVSDIKIVDEFTVSVWTPYVKATLIDDLTSLPIVPKYIWESVSNPLGNMKPADLVGSGPFVYEDMLKDAWYKFKRAPNYHGAADYPGVRDVDEGLNGIIYTVYSDMPALASVMNSGVEDTVVLTGDVPTFVDTVGKDASVNVIKAAVFENGICDVAINAIPDEFRLPTYGQGHVALLDPEVRRAIMMTLNKQYINETLLSGLAQVGDSVVDPGFWHKTIENQLPYDPAAARAYLEANGWEDGDGDGYLEATSTALGVEMDYFDVGTELTGIRCQAPDTDPTYGNTVLAWQGWAKEAGIGLVSTVESEITMINIAWYKADYDIWVWHWGWGPEPLGGALTCWLTSTLEGGGDNCQMPMGEWWAGSWNYTTCPYINASMIEEFNMDDSGFNGFSSFDQNCSIAMHTLDVDDRKAIVDDLQQMVYDSYCENPPFYDLGLYAYTDARFENWGDWEAHNGLNTCSDLLWLWFQVEPVDNRAPVFNVPPEESYTAYVDTPEDFSVAVSDPEGDELYCNYSFGDGATQSFHLTGDTTVRQYCNVSYTYTAAANLELSVSLTDMFEGRIYYRNASVEVVGMDAPPEFTSAVTSNVPSPAYIETPVTWSVSAMDPDGGTMGTDLKFTWDWDDFTYTVDPKTGIEDGVPVTSEVAHTWAVPGDYTVKVSVWDTYSEEGEHNVSLSMAYSVIVNEPPTEPVVQSIYGKPGEDTTCIAASTDADLDELTFTWVWDDGTVTVDKPTTYIGDTLTSEVVHVWDAEGTFTIEVFVDDGEPGHNVSTQADAVISLANVQPSSFNLAVTPSPVYVGVETTFNASAIDADGDDLIITVAFGDGNVSSATTAGGITTRQYAEFLHAYELPNTYAVTVWADDGEVDHNVSSTFTVTASVESNVAPQVQLPSAFSAKYNVERAFAPLSVTDADGDELTAWFSWGDDTPMTMGDPDKSYAANHTYTDTGSFTLTLYVDDGNGHNQSNTATVTVSEANYKPTVETLALEPDKDEYAIGETITFTVTVSDLEGDEVTVVIEFGDGTSDEETVDLEGSSDDYDVTFTHSYEADGDYVVNATADDGLDHADTVLSKKDADVTVAAESVNWVLYLGIAILLIVVVVAALLLMKRKKKGAAEGLGGMEGMAPAEEPPPAQ